MTNQNLSKDFKEKNILRWSSTYSYDSWIFNLIYKKRIKFNISSIQIPDEKFIFNIEDIVRL